MGTKAEICEMIEARGGYANEKWQYGHYLVVGSFGHPEWAHHKFGRKIEGRAKYGDTAGIISEQFLKKMFEKHPTIQKELV